MHNGDHRPDLQHVGPPKRRRRRRGRGRGRGRPSPRPISNAGLVDGAEAHHRLSQPGALRLLAEEPLPGIGGGRLLLLILLLAVG